jgi:DNA-binding CsgD family transcriptional regulator/tetratricopeptide (TPR) repeat protein
MELLERGQNLADLTEWFRATESGGCIALVSGEAGVGKTSLLQDFSQRVSKVRVLWGACDALFTPQPLAPLYDIARQTRGALLATLNSKANRDLIFEVTLDELARSAALVVFEDMHWADEATLDLLKFLGRRIERTQAMLALTYRDDEVGPRHPLRFVIGDLPRARTHRMALSPLSESAVAQLATQAQRSSKDLYAITGGNPLFVSEVLAAGGDTVPVTVRDAVLARAVRLSPAAREIAELVSVVPGRAESWLLEQVIKTDPAAIESCLSIGMVRYEDSSLAFRHELARRALEDSLTPSQQVELHGKVLAALATRPGIPAARLAHHAAAASDGKQVLRYAPIAAKQAATTGAHREAVSHYRAALQHGETLSPGERARLQDEFSYELYLTGEYEAAIDVHRAALEYWRSSGQRIKEGDALRRLANMSWSAGRNGDANAYGTEAVKTLESQPPSPELARAYCTLSDLAMESHDLDASIDWAQRAIALAERWGNDEIVCDALNVLGITRLIRGDVAGWADLNRSLQLAQAIGSHEQIPSAYTSLGAMAVSRRQYEDALRYINEGLEYCEQRDLDFQRPYMLAYRARLQFERGEWLAASEDIEAALSHPRTSPVTRIPALRTLGHLRVRRGDPDAYTPLRECRICAGPVLELQRVGTLAAVYAEAAWLAGDREGVVQAARLGYEMSRSRTDPRMNGELAVWLWRMNALEGNLVEMAEPYALEISGDWQGAAEVWKTLGCPYEHATVLAWHGGEAEQREALAIFEQLGASPAAQVLRRQMRAKGVRRVPRGSRKSTRSNALGLTRREAEILELLSEGLRNSAIAKRLFVSTKTVDHHVSAILAKLGVPSRAEAVAMARKRS